MPVSATVTITMVGEIGWAVEAGMEIEGVVEAVVEAVLMVVVGKLSLCYCVCRPVCGFDCLHVCFSGSSVC